MKVSQITRWTALESPARSLQHVHGTHPFVHHQAHQATQPPGHLLTAYFLASSIPNNPTPNAAGKKKCSAGTALVASTLCSGGMYSQKMAMTRAKAMAGKSQRFCVCLLKQGGCWKMLRRRVRTAMRLNHCLFWLEGLALLDSA